MSAALLDAFRDLLLERGYARLTIRDLIARAHVARSTFYEYFDDKTDILRLSIKPLFSVLAGCVNQAACSKQLPFVLEHFWSNRRVGRQMLTGPTRDIVVRILADEIESILRQRQAARAATLGTLVPVRMAAAQIAGAQWALIGAWVSEKSACSAQTLATALHETSNSLSRTLMADERSGI